MTVLETLFRSFLTSLLFIGVSMPITYKLTGWFSEKIAVDGCPTAYGHLLHTTIFLLLAFLLNVSLSSYLEKNEGAGVMFTCAVMSTLLFYFVSNSELYQVTSNVNDKLTVAGCPGYVGVIVHSFVFMLLSFGMMNLPKNTV